MPAKTGDRAAAGCLALFGLPFAAVGVVALYLALSALWTWGVMRGWVEVPAEITSLALEEHDGDDGSSYEVRARYRYAFGGRDYDGNRVAISGMADNVGPFQRNLYARLRAVENAPGAARADVDPASPSSATLNRDLRPGLLALELAFGPVFGGVGFGLMIGARYGAKKAARERERAALHPNEPWRWREDWAAGAIESSTRASAYAVAGFAVFWNLVSLPVALIVPGEVASGNFAALIALIFPLVGAALAAWAVRAWLRMRRFKSATLVLASTPVPLGGRLRGTIRVDAHVPAAKDFRVDVTCLERVRVRTSKGSKTSERLLWQNTWTVPRERCQLMDHYSAIPLDFPLPGDLPPAGTGDDADRLEWRLDATAECPGPDFWMRVELPVFAVEGASRIPTLDEAFASGAGGAGADEPEAQRLAGALGDREEPAAPSPDRLAALGIVYARLPHGGESWTFKRAQHKSVATMLTLVALAFGAAAVLMYAANAPLVLALVFAGFDALIVYFALHLWFAEYRVTLDDRLLTVARKGVAGAGKVVEIPRGWVKIVRAQRGMQAGNKLYYDLEIETADSTLTAASSVGDYTVASWLASRWMGAERQRA
jgi:hypothetical protein